VNPESLLIPHEKWTCGVKFKPTTFEKAVKKMDEYKSVGRLISMSSSMEQMIAYPIYKRVIETLRSYDLVEGHGIMIGLNKMGHDWVRLGNWVARGETVYVGDWSTFDQSVCRRMMERAFEVIFHLFDVTDTATYNYLINFQNYCEKEVLTRHYSVNDCITIKVQDGVPSGSLWTSVIGSIVNYICINEVLEELSITNCEIKVYGDDHIIRFDKVMDLSNFKEDFARVAYEKFGLINSVEDAALINKENFFVTYKKPIFANLSNSVFSKASYYSEPTG